MNKNCNHLLLLVATAFIAWKLGSHLASQTTSSSITRMGGLMYLTRGEQPTQTIESYVEYRPGMSRRQIHPHI